MTWATQKLIILKQGQMCLSFCDRWIIYYWSLKYKGYSSEALFSLGIDQKKLLSDLSFFSSKNFWTQERKCLASVLKIVLWSTSFSIIFIDREAREIIRLVTSVRPSVRLSVCLFVYALTSESFDTWNTVQDLCVFVSNQETFAVKSCAQRSRAFNYSEWLIYYTQSKDTVCQVRAH